MVREAFRKMKPIQPKPRKSIREFIKQDPQKLMKSVSSLNLTSNSQREDLSSLRQVPSELFFKKNKKDELFYLNLEEDYKQKVDKKKQPNP